MLKINNKDTNKRRFYFVQSYSHSVIFIKFTRLNWYLSAQSPYYNAWTTLYCVLLQRCYADFKQVNASCRNHLMNESVYIQYKNSNGCKFLSMTINAVEWGHQLFYCVFSTVSRYTLNASTGCIWKAEKMDYRREYESMHLTVLPSIFCLVIIIFSLIFLTTVKSNGGGGSWPLFLKLQEHP